MKFLVSINNDVQSAERALIEAYWAVDQGAFVNKVADLAAAHELTVPALTQLVRSHSNCQVSFGYCEGCGDELLGVVNTKSALQAGLLDFEGQRCAQCQRAYEKRQRFEQRVAAGQVGSVLGHNAVELQTWELLPIREREVLSVIVQLKWKPLIYAYLFKDGNLSDKNVWEPINKLVKKGLLVLLYDFDSGRIVEGFEYPHVLEAVFSHCALSAAPKTSPSDYFGLRLHLNPDKSAPHKATYTGVFTMQQDVLLRQGKRYAYGGWVRKRDNTVTLQITPFEQIVDLQLPTGNTIEAQVIKLRLSYLQTIEAELNSSEQV